MFENCIVLYRIALRCVALRCVALRSDAMRCDAMRCAALRCAAMRRTAQHRTATQRIASHRIASYRIVSYRIVSYRIVSYRIVLYCTVLYCTVCIVYLRGELDAKVLTRIDRPRRQLADGVGRLKIALYHLHLWVASTQVHHCRVPLSVQALDDIGKLDAASYDTVQLCDKTRVIYPASTCTGLND